MGPGPRFGLVCNRNRQYREIKNLGLVKELEIERTGTVKTSHV